MRRRNTLESTSNRHAQARHDEPRRSPAPWRSAALTPLALALLAGAALGGGAPAPASPSARAILDRVAARYLLPKRQQIQLEITAVIFGHTRRATGRVAYSPPAAGEDPEGGQASVEIDGQASSIERERKGTTSRTGKRSAWREIAPEHRTPVRSPILLALRGLDRKSAVLVGRQKAKGGAAGQVVIEAPLLDPRPPFRAARVRALEPGYELVSLELLDEHGEALLAARVVNAGPGAAPEKAHPGKERVR